MIFKIIEVSLRKFPPIFSKGPPTGSVDEAVGSPAERSSRENEPMVDAMRHWMGVMGWVVAVGALTAGAQPA
ncbi:MAG TPA: hypothetical protein VF664_00065, partial [Cystobacter sp.]